MGRAARWLRGLLGGKKAGSGELSPAEPKEKRRWGLGKSFREKERQQGRGESPRPRSTTASEELKWPLRAAGLVMADEEEEEEEEENKRAIAVAAATSAVAEAAVAAAKAAAVVVRLTSSRRIVVDLEAGKWEEWAAIKIQSAFRGYLARRALKALRGLVKLQALVRGNIVRKQAAETLRCMQALVRVQTRARARRALSLEKSRSDKDSRVRAGLLRPEDYEQGVHAIDTKSNRFFFLKRNSSKTCGFDAARKGGTFAPVNGDRIGKIHDADRGKPQFSHTRNVHHQSNSNSTLTSEHHSRSYTTVQDSPSKDSTIAPSSVDLQQCLSSLWLAPSSADYLDCFFGGSLGCPSYMAKTESSMARSRSHSAPKQRLEREKSGSINKFSAPGFGQRSSSVHAKFANRAYPGSGRLDRLGMPLRRFDQ